MPVRISKINRRNRKTVKTMKTMKAVKTMKAMKTMKRKQTGGAPLKSMPQICFGTVQANLNKTLPAAIKMGYRHIDGAEAYGPVAKSIISKELKKIPRKDMWITWKDNGITMEKIRRIIDKLDCSYIDLFLIHHSCGSPADFTELKKAQAAGLIRFYGVSNCEDIEVIKKLKKEHNIYANQIQARPPGGRVAEREPMPADFIEQCNAIGVNIMLFGTISGISNSDNFGPIIDDITNVNKYYIQKYISRMNVLMVASISGSSLQQNLDDVTFATYGAKLLSDDTIRRIEDNLKRVQLSHQ